MRLYCTFSTVAKLTLLVFVAGLLLGISIERSLDSVGLPAMPGVTDSSTGCPVDCMTYLTRFTAASPQPLAAR